MDLLKILRSFEEFLFEAVSWLVFYPLTLWRILRGPLAAMDYSDREQSDSPFMLCIQTEPSAKIKNFACG